MRWRLAKALIGKRVIRRGSDPRRASWVEKARTTGEKNGFALDDCDNPGDFVALGDGEFVHARRICSHSVGIGDHCCIDPSDSRATAGLGRVGQGKISVAVFHCE